MRVNLFVAFMSLIIASEAQREATCTCLFSIGRQSHLSASGLLGEQFRDAPRPEFCDQDGVAECRQYCLTRVGLLTNRFTLDETPHNLIVAGVSLGQLMCDMLGRDVGNERVQLMSELTCRVPGSDSSMKRAKLTGQFTKEKLFCRNGVYKLN
ncbi:hypothetical protein HDE_05915 [Halotydeus destructor]|nr:hypothetical protein HDE_05915 [Halotydeus destructor]